jgi:flagellar hook-length control protein FliK
LNFFPQIINPEVAANPKSAGINPEALSNQPKPNDPFCFLSLLETVDMDYQGPSTNNGMDYQEPSANNGNDSTLTLLLQDNHALLMPHLPVDSHADNSSQVVTINPETNLITNQIPAEIPVDNSSMIFNPTINKLPIMPADQNTNPAILPPDVETKQSKQSDSGSFVKMSNPSIHPTKVPLVSPLFDIVSELEPVNQKSRIFIQPFQSEEKILSDFESNNSRPKMLRTNLPEMIKITSKIDNKVPPPVIDSLKITEVAIDEKASVKPEKEIIESAGRPLKAANIVIIQNFDALSKSEPGDTKTIQSPVRFSIVENINNETIKTGRTITIKMEPEHLGSIRLTLTSHHHGIIGRMVVNNPAALAVIESNIENLHQELSAKGVRLDAFQVSVGGEQTEKKSTSGEMNLSQRGGKVWSDNENKIVGQGEIMVGTSSAGTYINAGGVNWLA